jgi:hypothetical protein
VGQAIFRQEKQNPTAPGTLEWHSGAIGEKSKPTGVPIFLCWTAALSGDGSTAQEVHDDGNDCQNEQNVNHAGGHVKCDEAEQPHHEQNQPD